MSPLAWGLGTVCLWAVLGLVVGAHLASTAWGRLTGWRPARPVERR